MPVKAASSFGQSATVGYASDENGSSIKLQRPPHPRPQPGCALILGTPAWTAELTCCGHLSAISQVSNRRNVLRTRCSIFLTWVAAAIGTTSLVAFAQTDIDSVIANTARSGKTIAFQFDSGVSGRAVRVGEFQGCTWVGLVLAGTTRKGSERIDNYRVCGSEIRRVEVVSPALPSEPTFKRAVIGNIDTAVRYGHQDLTFGEYDVSTVRLSPLGSDGCAYSETVISSNGLLVTYAEGRSCVK